jgi:hypothetical protein
MPQEARKCEFEMAVKDVFAFEDGRTVFAGEITGGPNYITGCDCELLIADAPVARFRIEDEMIPSRKEQKNLRSVSTTERVDVALLQRSKGQCKLRGV